MANELEPYGGGEIQPYTPGTGVDLFQSDAESHWGDQTDLLSTHAPLPAQQVEANLQQIATVFSNDMASLGYVQADISRCVDWFRQNLANPITRMPAKKHNYETWQFSNDPAFQEFCNYAATQCFPQSLIQSVAYWIQRFDDFTHGVGAFANNAVAQGRASSSNVEDQLTDAQHAQVVAANERAAAQTMGRLRDMWGSSFEANMRVVQKHFASLTDAEQEHLGQFTGNWIRGTNTFEILTSLYAQAVQAHTIPRDGASIERELKAITRYMKERRADYLKDEVTQARYRELLNQQSGGR